MAVTAAEKQRRYHEKRDADPEKKAMFLKQQREIYERDKQRGLEKVVKDMSPREHRAAKKVWRNQNRATREKQKRLGERGDTTKNTPITRPSISISRASTSCQRAQAAKTRR